MRWFRRAWVLVPLAAVVLLAGSIYLPYYSIGPGPARPVGPLIRFDGEPRYESEGRFVLTSIHYEQLTPIGMLQAWLDPDRSVVGRDFLFRPGESAEEEERRSVSEMDQSKIAAASVVLEELTEYPEDHGPGVLIEGVVEGCAAAGELFPGDLVRAIDGQQVLDVEDARRAIRASPSGRRLTFDVTVDGRPETVSLLREPCGGSERPLVGVSMIESFPIEIRISSGGIGGPSAGLAWALGLYDLLTPGDLAAGRTIAVTGQLAVDGSVLPIGASDEKVVAASDAGATVLFLPRDNLAEARSVGDRGVELVPVATFEDALAWLQGNA
ncbi:MAG: YlbL family protein [Actinomycetota bacterium]